MESVVPQFKHNDIVWAKVTGHPWWPGVIAEENQFQNLSLYRVDFFGYPPSHSLLPCTKIIRYEDYHKLASTEISGRACPGLKKAISEASILFNTLQQSKTSPINKALTQSCLFETENTVVTSSCKGEQKNYLDQKIINQQLQFHNSFSEDHEGATKKCKKIKKHVLKTKPMRFKIEAKHNEKLNEEVRQLLKAYNLQNIPDVPKQNAHKIDKDVAKLLYRLYRKNHSRQQSIALALSLKGKISKKAQIDKIIENQANLALTQQEVMKDVNDF